jgi:YD repeat-containing protein
MISCHRNSQDSRGWLLGLQTLSPSAATLHNLTFARNAMGRIGASTSDAAAEGWTYGYDDFDRLTQATNTGNAGLN